MSGDKRRPPSPVMRAAAREQEARAGGEARVLPFKRGAAAPRRRRPNPWRALLAPLVLALATVGAPLGLVLWVLVSPRFDLRDIRVLEGRLVGETWVRTSLAPLLGSNLPALDLSRVEEILASHPWAGAVELRKQLPDRLQVRVVERRPAGLLRDAGGLRYVDEAGRPFAPFDGGRVAELGTLLLVGAADGRSTPSPRTIATALDVARRFEAANLAWLRQPSEIEVLGAEDFRVYTEGAPFALLVRPETLEGGLERLRLVATDLASRYARLESIDLRLDRRLVLRPANLVASESLSLEQPVS